MPIPKFMHFRMQFPIGLFRAELDSRGGATVSYVEHDDKLYAAVAYCNPTDNFQYKYGRNKASGRLRQLLAKPELADNDKYFILDVERGLSSITDFMVGDMGYYHRGPRQKAQ